jgi:hypothetical protein
MKSMTDRVVECLLSDMRCPDCEAEFHAEDVHVLEQRRDEVWDLAVVCHACQTLSLMRAIVSQRSVARARGHARHSELTPAERDYYAGLRPIVADDVLDMMAFLDSFDGDFRALFAHEDQE